jgi:rubredoxin
MCSSVRSSAFCEILSRMLVGLGRLRVGARKFARFLPSQIYIYFRLCSLTCTCIVHRAIAEAAYRTSVLAAGKNQKGLTAGWEVLGLSKEVATRIYDAEKKEGFLSDRETMYGGQTRKYDRAGRQLDGAGKLANPEEAGKGEEDVPESTSNVYECGQCGFTLFVATGRESKFFGKEFKCPECGAAKKEFKARDDMDD